MDYKYTAPDGEEVKFFEKPLTRAEIEEITSQDERFRGVFRVELGPLLENGYDEAVDWMLDYCVLGGESCCEMEDWSYIVVGCEEDNVLHILFDGWLYEL